MKPDASRPSTWHQGLRFRLITMMSVALLPIGLIAVSQTNNVTEKAAQNKDMALLALTKKAALEERMIVQRAFGVAEGVASFFPSTFEDASACPRMFSRLIQTSEQLSFAGFLPVSGKMVCSSADSPFDFSDDPGFAAAVADPRQRIEINTDIQINGASFVSVTRPIFQDEALAGFVLVGIPHFTLNAATTDADNELLVDILTFNRSGDFLTTRDNIATAKSRLPANFDLTDLADSRTFFASGADGVKRIYTFVPIENGNLSVLGIWDAKIGLSQAVNNILPTSAFPVLMWFISLAVALFAVHRLVSRHIRSIGAQMVRFAKDRTLQTDTGISEMPTELNDIQAAFFSMANVIVREEANLEDAVHQKSVLLKEVHHRVKNNLQLISSILNMQIREAAHDDTKRILRRMQDRVLSLATIHQDLYETSKGGLVNVGALVREVIDKSVEIGVDSERAIRVEADIDDIMLYPDQAVPMSLLAAEVAANAMKYVGTTGEKALWISVSFKHTKDDDCCFEFSNSIGKPTMAESTGMGAKLISAFAIQLGADIDVNQDAENYKISVSFKATAFDPESAEFQ